MPDLCLFSHARLDRASFIQYPGRELCYRLNLPSLDLLNQPVRFSTHVYNALSASHVQWLALWSEELQNTPILLQLYL